MVLRRQLRHSLIFEGIRGIMVKEIKQFLKYDYFMYNNASSYSMKKINEQFHLRKNSI